MKEAKRDSKDSDEFEELKIEEEPDIPIEKHINPTQIIDKNQRK
jgi:hypothetical protein